MILDGFSRNGAHLKVINVITESAIFLNAQCLSSWDISRRRGPDSAVFTETHVVLNNRMVLFGLNCSTRKWNLLEFQRIRNLQKWFFVSNAECETKCFVGIFCPKLFCNFQNSPQPKNSWQGFLAWYQPQKRWAKSEFLGHFWIVYESSLI